MPKPDILAKLLKSAGIPPEAIAQLVAYMETQKTLKNSMKINPNAKLDTSQIDDKRPKAPKPSRVPEAKEK